MTKSNASFSDSVVSWKAWSFIGVVLAFSFFYWQEYREKYNFRMEINNVFNLVEVRESVKDLQVLYKGEDIVKSGREVKVAIITIRNKGEIILQQYYDNLEPFGLKFPEANILDFSMIGHSSEDLKRKIILDKTLSGNTRNEILIPKVIFEKGDFVILKVVLMQKNNEKFSVLPLGKIANIRKLEVVDVKVEDRENGASREPFYFLGGIAGFLLFMFFLGSFLEKKEKRSRQERIDNFLSRYGECTKNQSDIIKSYLENWSPAQTKTLKSVLSGEEIVSIQSYIKDGTLKGYVSASSLLVLFFSSSGTLTKLDKNIYTLEANTLKINKENKEFLNKFFHEVISKEKIKS